jgi:soluble lytic murein transglycosylase-like protein
MERSADADEERLFVTNFYRIGISVFSLATATFAAPANATTSDSVRQVGVQANAIPNAPSAEDNAQFSAIYVAIADKKWDEAARLIEAVPKGPMAAMARAELYLAAGSPKVEASKLQSLLNDAPYLPQAEQLATMAAKRGASDLPSRPGTQRFSYRGSAPKRDLPDTISGANSVREQIQKAIKADDPMSAERAVEAAAVSLPLDALTELRYRVAWSYYIENDDGNARRVAGVAKAAGGEWAVQADWVYALSSWRMQKYQDAFAAFDDVARRSGNDELKAAALFWSARAAMAVKQPQQVQSRLQSAASKAETFYGLLAGEALGMEPVAHRWKKHNDQADWKHLAHSDNVQIAIGLAAIGKENLADETIRHQAKIGNPEHHDALARLAGALGLPATQLWMGHYGPRNSNAEMLSRYPYPNWTPSGGWRVDSALAYAHALQESQFRTSVVSGAGARGLMQVRPGTAQDLARDKGYTFRASDLDRPAMNLEYGQSYMEKLRDMNGTGGLLPKVIAAYNAGPAPVIRWNNEIRDNGDPLLFMESIPYWETRGYVAIILRNYWIYEAQMGKNGGSMTGLAQYLWPRFPVNGRSTAVRISTDSPYRGGRLVDR